MAINLWSRPLKAGAEFALMDDQTLSAAKFLEPYGDPNIIR